MDGFICMHKIMYIINYYLKKSKVKIEDEKGI